MNGDHCTLVLHTSSGFTEAELPYFGGEGVGVIRQLVHSSVRRVLNYKHAFYDNSKENVPTITQGSTQSSWHHLY